MPARARSPTSWDDRGDNTAAWRPGQKGNSYPFLGLAAFAAEQRTREIGVRKVLGASTAGIIGLLSRDFMKWVVAANLVAWPVGYFVMSSWLRNSAYRTSLTATMFLGAALAAFLLAAAVIGLQTYRAASANPAVSMRYE